MTPLPSRLLVVTDRALAAGPLEAAVADALAGGARWIWFRDRDLPADVRLALGARLLRLCEEAGATLTVGGDAVMARAIGAGAVHLSSGANPAGARGMLGAGALVGVSAHSLQEAALAHAQGADYVTLSPVFASASKPGYGPALGLATLERARDLALPVVALGGVDAVRAPACLAAGARAVAVMGAVMTAPAPGRVVAACLAALPCEWEASRTWHSH